MTDKIDREIMQQALDALIENARLLGITQAKRGYGFYSQEDAIFERALHECIAKHSAVLRERLAQPDPLQRFTDVQQEIEAALAPDTQPRRIALDLEELHLKAKKRAKKEAALSWPEGNNRKRMQEELTDRYFYEYTGGQK
ncbi:MAG: hypothetical protein IM326_17010 [Microcystis sp. M020S1]|jgi:hypothetical protein|uniref:hypothetical protein n=1 Tax=unclassified Microcystis TaxID=2643300 RepID=UPI00258DD5F0|nr:MULTISPECIES: hypothetical protein [unclassified Microcystis]MCA2927752.1 hypothetical protein [Microcystis sp. M020S1]MCA3159281.1 hypothetical protein [Burkholderiales bacterium]MCA2862860.1 hypothetical protein [Microcystis sp. M049S1]MCA2931925.1 hypothetical protein [Microcystis sp. M018S1]MCA3160559.1 hypothetical protein [Burkholderiales bacterium]